MGFPIRKSADQSSFAAPHGLSQRITSFIASQRQGIHRMLLRHLIVLMIDVRDPEGAQNKIRKTIYACRMDPIKRSRLVIALRTPQDERLSNPFPLHNDKQRRQKPPCSNRQNLNSGRFWWSQTGSNRRPEACKATALPTELWPRFEPQARRSWWAWEDLNLRPHAYQARALTN